MRKNGDKLKITTTCKERYSPQERKSKKTQGFRWQNWGYLRPWEASINLWAWGNTHQEIGWRRKGCFCANLNFLRLDRLSFI